jgi:alpha,alpha-trehalase
MMGAGDGLRHFHLDDAPDQLEKAGIDVTTNDAVFAIDRTAIDAVVFDMDGVVTRTAAVHAAAWKQLFDDFLEKRAAAAGAEWTPFDADADYRVYVDGKARSDGVRSFLASRDIVLPDGVPDDPPDAETVWGLGNRKNGYFLAELERSGVQAFESTVRLVRSLQQLGIGTAIISASLNATAVLGAAGIGTLFPVQVDGVVAREKGLAGKPDPAVFIEAARQLGAVPERAIVVEDALAGVEAGRRGGFAHTIGVDRTGYPEALRESGADVVVPDLADVTTDPPTLPSALTCAADIARRIGGTPPAVFLDYDGTLTPIVARPEMATLSAEMETVLRDLAARCPVAILSGRDLANLQGMVTLPGLVYAGSHGFDVDAPEELGGRFRRGEDFAEVLAAARARLKEAIAPIANAWVEDKAFAVTVHFRQVAPEDEPAVEAAFAAVADAFPDLRRTGGKKVLELRPNVDWDKGKALQMLLERIDRSGPHVPLFVGDDETDEDAFRAVADSGIGVRVGDSQVASAAQYFLADTDEAAAFLKGLAR